MGLVVPSDLGMNTRVRSSIGGIPASSMTRNSSERSSRASSSSRVMVLGRRKSPLSAVSCLIDLAAPRS
eukprot:3918844-Heterocapsa_arctica.AAC.1